jgi:hypothetical protein
MCTVLLPPGVNPVAVKYIPYHITTYHIITPWLRDWCVLWYNYSESVTVQRLRKRFCRKPPAKMSNYKWHNLLSQTSCICKGTRPSKRPLTETEVNEVQVRFLSCPNARQACAHNWQCTKLCQLVWAHQMQHATTQDKEVTYTFCCDVLWKRRRRDV